MAHKPTSKPVAVPKAVVKAAQKADHVRVAINERQAPATKFSPDAKVNESTNTTGPKGS